MDIFQRPNTLLSGIEARNLVILTYENKSMNGPALSMVIFGKRVITTTFLDTNLLHNIVTGKLVSAILHFVNTTPMDWFLKRQGTVETATYGSEF